MFAGLVLLERQLESEPLRVEVSLPAELERVEAGAGADRRQEEVEGSRGGSGASSFDGLIRDDREPLVESRDLEATRELDRKSVV